MSDHSASSDEQVSGTAAAADSRKSEMTPDRRRFLVLLNVGLSSFAGVLLGVPVVGFLLAPLLKQPPAAWRAVGKVENFTLGHTVEVTFLNPSPLPWAGYTAKTAAWLRRDTERRFRAFSIDCTHLGCPVDWLPDAQLFMCPCHGGVFYKNGNVAAGPPPRPLQEYPTRVRNGQVEVRTSPLPISVTTGRGT